MGLRTEFLGLLSGYQDRQLSGCMHPRRIRPKPRPRGGGRQVCGRLHKHATFCDGLHTQQVDVQPGNQHQAAESPYQTSSETPQGCQEKRQGSQGQDQTVLLQEAQGPPGRHSVGGQGLLTKQETLHNQRTLGARTTPSHQSHPQPDNWHHTRFTRDRGDWKLVKQRPQHLQYPTTNFQNTLPTIQEFFD